MTELEPPLKRELSEELSEATVLRMWNGVRARRRAAPSVAVRGALRIGIAAAILGVVVALMFTTVRFRGAPLDGPLRRADGAQIVKMGAAAASVTTLSDGSNVELEASSELEVLDNNGQRFVTSLRRGRGTFEVVPGGRRRWTIEAGLASIEVVGTRFSVLRTPDAVEVSVTHGVVLVRGERVPDRVQRLSVGQSLRIVAETPPFAAPRDEAVDGAKSAPILPESQTQASNREEPSVSDSFAELLTQADAERRAGNMDGAIRALRKALGHPRRDARSAQAAFTLGKLLFDRAGRAGEAADAFRLCLSLSPPATLAEDALARLVEAEVRAGQKESAKVSAERYLRNYPSGHRRRDVEQWLAGL